MVQKKKECKERGRNELGWRVPNLAIGKHELVLSFAASNADKKHGHSRYSQHRWSKTQTHHSREVPTFLVVKIRIFPRGLWRSAAWHPQHSLNREKQPLPRAWSVRTPTEVEGIKLRRDSIKPILHVFGVRQPCTWVSLKLCSSRICNRSSGGGSNQHVLYAMVSKHHSRPQEYLTLPRGI